MILGLLVASEKANRQTCMFYDAVPSGEHVHQYTLLLRGLSKGYVFDHWMPQILSISIVWVKIMPRETIHQN